MIYLSGDNNYDTLAARGMMCSKKNDVYKFLNDQDYRVRTLAAQSIQTKYPTKKSFEIAKRMIQSNKSDQVELGAYILGQLGTPNMPFWKESLPLLTNIIETSNDKKSITSALHALSHLCSLAKCKIDEKLISSISTLANTLDKDIIIGALMALSSQYENKTAKQVIENIIKNSNDKEIVDWAKTAKEIIDDV
jgi:hypothetical protein